MHIYKYIHTCKPVCVKATCTHTHADSAFMHACACMHANIHVCNYTCTDMKTRPTCVNIYTNTCKLGMHACKYAHIHM